MNLCPIWQAWLNAGLCLESFSMGYRKDYIERAIKMVALTQRENGFTAKDVKNQLNISDTGAYRWIRDISALMPIYESGKREHEGRGRPATIYSILRD